MNNILTLENCKSYATEKALMKKIEQIGFYEICEEYADRVIICKNTENRWTAIFEVDKHKGGYICRYSQHGFLTI